MERVVNKCLICGNEMRSWHTQDFEAPTYESDDLDCDGDKIIRHHTKYVAMCITSGCIEQGEVYRALEFPVKIEGSISI